MHARRLTAAFGCALVAALAVSSATGQQVSPGEKKGSGLYKKNEPAPETKTPNTDKQKNIAILQGRLNMLQESFNAYDGQVTSDTSFIETARKQVDNVRRQIAEVKSIAPTCRTLRQAHINWERDLRSGKASQAIVDEARKQADNCWQQMELHHRIVMDELISVKDTVRQIEEKEQNLPRLRTLINNTNELIENVKGLLVMLGVEEGQTEDRRNTPSPETGAQEKPKIR